MIEQKQQFQKEIDALRKALEQRAEVGHDNEDTGNMTIHGKEVDEPEVDSSDDEASMTQNSKSSKTSNSKTAKSIIIHKRPTRSKFRTTRACGGPSSSTIDLNE